MEIEIPKRISKNPGNLDLIKHAARSNPLVEILFLLLVVGLFSWMALRPKIYSFMELKGTLAQAQQDKDASKAELEKLTALIGVLKNSGKEVAELDEALPLEASNVRQHQLIQALARQIGLTVGDINIASQGDAIVSGNKDLLSNPYVIDRHTQKVSVGLYVIGNFQQVQAFLEALENNARIMDILSLKMSANQDGLLDVKMNINLYYFGQNIKS